MGGGWRYPTPSRSAPVPAQRRAFETVRAAIDATVELLDQHPDEQVTLDAIRRRSGVSQGSLAHHFGNRDALLATAHVERYLRSAAADEEFLGKFGGTDATPETFAATMLAMIGDMLSPERREVRWLRMSAIAAALGDEALSFTLSHRYTALTDRLTALVEGAQTTGVVEPDVHARTIALLLSMHAQGLVLDDLVGTDVPASAWNHLQVRFVSCFVTPAVAHELRHQEQARFGDLWRAEIFGPPGRVPSDAADRLAELRTLASRSGLGAVSADDMVDPERVVWLLRLAEEQPGEGAVLTTSDPSSCPHEQLVSEAGRQLRLHGAAAVDVEALRTATSMTNHTYHRTYGGRDGLIRRARIRLEIVRAAHSTSRFARMISDSQEPAIFRARLERDAIRMGDDRPRLAMWQRIETLAATRTDVDLRISLARVQRVARDLLIEQVCRAQVAGLLDPELAARGVARFLDGTAFWHVFHGLDERRPDRDAWLEMLRRIARLLSPDR
jgi:AcrR family transcriptional regulator